MLQSLFDRIDARRDDLIALTRDLVRIPTINPPGDAYGACAELIGERLKGRGFDVQYLRAEGAVADSARLPRINVLARVEGAAPGPCVHFNGHMDVVAPGKGWTFDPFAATVEDGRIYGRGTCDMKGGIAASMIAVESILEQGIQFPGALEISGTVDEETGGYAGVAWMAKQGYFSKPRVDHVIIPEPLHKDCICLGHRGAYWAEVEVKGRIAHGSMPFLGISAIRGMGRFLDRLERDLFPRLRERETEMPVIPDMARRSTLNLNSLHGGEPEGFEGPPSPVVADSCRLVLDRRFLIEEDADAVKAEIVQILDELRAADPSFEYAIRDLMTVPPTMTEADSPLVHALEMGIDRVLGRPAKHVVSPGTYDQKHVVRIGELGACVAYGPGILDLAHQPDEYVVIDDMVCSAKVMAAAALRLLGVPIPP